MWQVSTQTIVAAVAVSVSSTLATASCSRPSCRAAWGLAATPEPFMAVCRCSSTASARYSDGATGRSPVWICPQPCLILPGTLLAMASCMRTPAG